MRKRQLRLLAFGLALCCLLAVTACEKKERNLLEGQRVQNYVAPRYSTILTAEQLPGEYAGQTTVSLYRRLGGNAPEYLQTVAVPGDVYTPTPDYKRMMDCWNMSSGSYAFVGWFYTDQAGQPAKWVGDGEIKLAHGKDTPLIAVFNTMAGRDSTAYVITLYAQFGTADPIHKVTGLGGKSFVLPDGEEVMQAWNLSPNQYIFEGWYYAAMDGTTRRLAEGDTVMVEPGIDRVLTAAFTDRIHGDTPPPPQDVASPF